MNLALVYLKCCIQTKPTNPWSKEASQICWNRNTGLTLAADYSARHGDLFDSNSGWPLYPANLTRDANTIRSKHLRVGKV